jgi:hypothetical protein
MRVLFYVARSPPAGPWQGAIENFPCVELEKVRATDGKEPRLGSRAAVVCMQATLTACRPSVPAGTLHQPTRSNNARRNHEITTLARRADFLCARVRQALGCRGAHRPRRINRALLIDQRLPVHRARFSDYRQHEPLRRQSGEASASRDPACPPPCSCARTGSLRTKVSVAGKRNFQGRDKEAETASKIQGDRCRDKIPRDNPANSGLVPENQEISVSGKMRGGGRSRSRTCLCSQIPC